MEMSDSEFLVIGKVLSADLDADGTLHITLKNSNQFWAEIATKRLRQLQGQIIKAEIKTWQPTTATAKQSTEKNTLKPI
jgi:hypothetical protein